MTTDIKKLAKLSPFEFKDKLISIAKGKDNHSILDTGRGNPNFFNSFVRLAFAEFQIIALEFSAKIEGDLYSYPLEGDFNYFAKLNKIIRKYKFKNPDIKPFLLSYIDFLSNNTPKSNINSVLHDIILSTIGAFYPNPPQIQPHLNIIVNSYMTNAVFGSTKSVEKYSYFACEGAAAGILYTFNTLSFNELMKTGDSIAIITPIFSPYLEMPKMKQYGLKIVELKCNPNDNYSLPDKEIDKLRNGKIKILFVVNPANPSDFALSESNIIKIKTVIDKYNKNLIIVSDDVYAPFVNKYTSFMKICPENTILIQSLSKYFGVTGWRLGLVMVQKNNIIDRLLQSSHIHAISKNRYTIASTDPMKLTFMERLVFDSRQVAEAHVGGLSTPQQVLLGMFLYYDYNLRTNNVYKKMIQKLLRTRMVLLYEPLETKAIINDYTTNYYTLLNIPEIAKNIYGYDAYKRIKKISPFTFLIYLAQKEHIVLLPGVGFAAEKWSLRVSLANLDTSHYRNIGLGIRNTIEYFANKK